MSIDELIEFFANNKVPSGTMLNQATTILNGQTYLEVNLDVIKSWKGDLDKCPSYWHLCELVNVLSKQTGQQNP